MDNFNSKRPDQEYPPKKSGNSDISRILIIVMVVVAIFILFVLPELSKSSSPSAITNYTQFMKEVTSKKVATAIINNNTGNISGTLRNKQSYNFGGPVPPIPQDQVTMRQDGVNVTYSTPTGSWLSYLPDILLLALFVGLLVIMIRSARGQMASIMSISKSRAKLYTSERPKTTFADVAGYNGVKLEISEVVDFLKAPMRYNAIGAKIPKGILLVGPPGTGKTLLARAVAGEAGVPFLSVSGSDFMEMFVGVGASRVRDLFQTARKQAPAIVFIDEIDSIGRKRGAGLGGGHDEREQTLNQLLSEMDGFDPSQGVIMIAATNRPDILDLALLRPGRFDRQIVVPLPDLEERLPILAVHCKDVKLSEDVDLEIVARGTPGLSGADLANLVNEAALHAVRRGSSLIEMIDFESARDRELMGQRRETTVLSDEEKERVAYHEAGHAVLAYVLDNADPLHKVTILPTGMALGVTQQLPAEERHIYSKQVIEDRIAVRMGGRVAELIMYGDLSTGASNDLQGNTELARKMVREWGFSERLGPLSFGDNHDVFLGEDLMHSRDYSEATSRVVDEEVSRILQEQQDRAMKILSKHKAGLEKVTAELLAKETISGEEVGKLIEEAHGGPVHSGKAATVPHFTPQNGRLTKSDPNSPVAASSRDS
jgi:cell division protease FtsH